MHEMSGLYFIVPFMPHVEVQFKCVSMVHPVLRVFMSTYKMGVPVRKLIQKHSLNSSVEHYAYL